MRKIEQKADSIEEKNDVVFEEKPEQGCCNTCGSYCGFFFRSTVQEVRNRKCSFFWGLMSILLVCTVVGVVFSISQILPVIILMLAENEAGEVDMKLQAGDWTGHQTLDYNKIDNVLKNSEDQYKHFTPRIEYESSAFSKIGGKEYSFTSNILLFDTQKEKDYEISRVWDKDAPPEGTGYISAILARQLHVNKGDTVEISFNAFEFSPLFTELVKNLSSELSNETVELWSDFKIPFTIRDKLDENTRYNKGEQSTDTLFVEFETFWSYFISKLPPQTDVDELTLSTWKTKDLKEFSQQILFSLPNPRHEIYLSFNTDSLKLKLVRWASYITYNLGFDDINPDMPVIESFSDYSSLGMMINMVSMLLIVVLVGISILLIYSLLQISVDTRTFELGVLRMVGFTRLGVVGLLVVQALFYSIPAWILGIGLGFLVNYIVVGVIGDVSNVPLNRVMPAVSVVLSAVVAFGISIVASILPIKDALGQNLHDSIDLQHSKTSAILVTIERSEDLANPWSLLICGFILAGIGMGIYYLFPLAMLSMNLTLMAVLFFVLMLCILISFIFLTINFEFLVEGALALVFLFWEKRGVKSLALKNLGAHRMRNRKTTLLYSTSLSFIVFLNVMLTIALDLVVTMQYMNHGCNLHVIAENRDAEELRDQQNEEGGGSTRLFMTTYDPTTRYFLQPDKLENITSHYSDVVEATSWETHDFETVFRQATRTQLANIGRSHAYYHDVRGISPNFLDHIDNAYFSIEKQHRNGDSVLKQLYTMDQLSGALLSNGLRLKTGGELDETFVLNIADASAAMAGLSGGISLFGSLSFVTQSVFRVNFTATAYASAMAKMNMPSMTIGSTDRATASVSIPHYLSMLNQTHAEMRLKNFFVQFKKKYDQARSVSLFDELRAFREDERDIETTYRVWSREEAAKNIRTASNIINIAFYGVTALIMILCFFSLMSSMHTNILEQSKDIGILRSVGVSSWEVFRMYVEEAFILVVTASFMGLVSGLVCGYLLISQMATLQGLPVPLYAPWQLILIMLGMSIVTAFLSATLPVLHMMRKPIVDIIKSV